MERSWLKQDVSFYRVGGGTRIAGFLLAVMTALLLFIGTAPIAYIREHPQVFGMLPLQELMFSI
jgi:hypothetical protein